MATQETPTQTRHLRRVSGDMSPDVSPDMSGDTCSQADAARWLGVSVRTVQRRIRTGKIAALDGRPLLAALPDVSPDTGLVSPDMSPDTVAIVSANERAERADERTRAAELRAFELERQVVDLTATVRLALDGRWRVRRAARRDLRTLLLDV